jgi:hypothetical protein
MSETKTLEIFTPLQTYFEILCESGKCDNFSGSDCQELINILTKTESSEPECVGNFINALKSFAYELKKADTPISLYTIKGKLKNIFLKSEKRDILDIVNNVDNATDLSGFKMIQDNGEGITYKEILENIINSAVRADNETIFNMWINKAFPIYEANIQYFNDKIKPNLKDLVPCQKRILNDYFEVKVGNSSSNVSVEDYISKMDSDYSGEAARLNTKVEGERAKIVNLLPESVKEAFDKFLVSPFDVKPDFVYKNGCYVLKPTTKEPVKEEYKVPDTNAVLEWFGKVALELNARPKGPSYVPEAEDKEPFVDSDNVEYNFPADFEVTKYQWGVDKSGKLYKKDDKGTFNEYPKSSLDADAKSFQSKDGNCGKLCIFEDVNECSKFFEKMIKGDPLKIDELSEIINNGDFVKSYKALKENIVNVNPLFVVGTLKLFGFQKYTELTDDGRKMVKIESFSRWWNRQNQDNKLSDKLKIETPFPGSHSSQSPPAPANLELFFKLLIAFINNNEFVLNPRDKTIMNKTGKPKLNLYGESKPTMMVNGKEVPNPYYKSASNGAKPESLSNLVNLMKKNVSYSSRPVSMGMTEGTLNLSTLLGLMVGVTNGGKISLSKIPRYSTGHGYVVGGGVEDVKVPNLLPCGADALFVYTEGIKALKQKGKTLNPKIDAELQDQIKQLSKLEDSVSEQLKVLASYVKIINILKDDKTQIIDNELMKDAIKKYNSSSTKLAEKSDSTIMSILKNLDENTGPSSFYSNV